MNTNMNTNDEIEMNIVLESGSEKNEGNEEIDVVQEVRVDTGTGIAKINADSFDTWMNSDSSIDKEHYDDTSIPFSILDNFSEDVIDQYCTNVLDWTVIKTSQESLVQIENIVAFLKKTGDAHKDARTIKCFIILLMLSQSLNMKGSEIKEIEEQYNRFIDTCIDGVKDFTKFLNDHPDINEQFSKIRTENPTDLIYGSEELKEFLGQ